MTGISDYFAAKSAPPEDLSHYQCAVQVLRAVAESGFQVPAEGHSTHYFQIPVGDARWPVATLLKGAMDAIDPTSNVYYVEEEGTITLEFDARLEKPPVRQVWAKMDELKMRVINACRDTKHGHYYALRDETTDFDVCAYLSHFASDSEAMSAYYRLPGEQPFTDSAGNHFEPGDYIGFHSFEEFKQVDPNAHDYDAMPLEAIYFDASVMQKVINGLGMGTPQARGSRN